MRIGINVPNELLQRLEPLKPELNISQVCREALEAKAESYEQMQARLGDAGVREAVARVWEQEKEFRAAIDFDWETLGYEDARAWVKAATRDDWNELLDWIEWSKESKTPEWEIFPPIIDGVNTIGERFRELTDSIRRMEGQEPAFRVWFWQKCGANGYMVNEREYMTAWMAYTKAAWGLVRQKEREYLEERSRQLQETRRNRPAPEAPEHLLADIRPRGMEPYEVVPHHAGFAPGVDPENPKRILADLDVEDYLAKQERIQ